MLFHFFNDYGSTMSTVITISTTVDQYDLYSVLGNPTTPVNIILRVTSSGIIRSSVAANPALKISGFLPGSQIELINDGLIVGCGGAPGQGGSGNGYGDGNSDGTAGGNGGNAILANFLLKVTNNGVIAGGGGGGGGGHGGVGSGGGGGHGRDLAPFDTEPQCRGLQGGSYDGSPGYPPVGYGLNGNPAGPSFNGGSGANGGNWGQAGGEGGRGGYFNRAGWAGGLAGKCSTGGNIDWVVAGSRYGSVE